MIENQWISFNPGIWGFDFACARCGAVGSADGDAPISAMNAMRERGWSFEEVGEQYIPTCPGCSD